MSPKTSDARKFNEDLDAKINMEMNKIMFDNWNNASKRYDDATARALEVQLATDIMQRLVNEPTLVLEHDSYKRLLNAATELVALFNDDTEIDQ